MPISSKKQETDTFTISLNDFNDSSADDFISDPDQFRDQLPQPYRCIDKVLTNLLDNAWEIIDGRESERIKEASKIKAPEYQCSITVEEINQATSICSTPDGQYMVIGFSVGLAVINTVNQHVISIWDQPLKIQFTDVAQLTDGWFSILTHDDKGVARIFAFAGEQLFLLHTINEGGSNGIGFVKKGALSAGSEFIAMFIEASSESFIDVHTLPVDVWLTELEAIVGPAKKQDTNSVQCPDGDVSQHTEVESEATAGIEAGSVQDGQSQSQRSQTPLGSQKGRSSPAVQASNHKFSPTTAILRIKPPTQLQGINWSSPYQLSKTVDNTGDVIGSGVNHMMSAQHLEQRVAMFEKLHHHHMKYLPEEMPEVIVSPTFHFLRPGQAMLHSTDKHMQVEPTSICVWWTGHPQICHYSLLKTGKDLERKADLVWHQAKDIVCTITSSCSSLLAIAVTDNTIVIWDRYLGLIRRVVYVDTESLIKKMEFLDPSICPQADTQYPPYGLHTNAYLMCVCENSQIYLIKCGQGENTPPSLICDKPEKEFERLTMVEPMKGLPELTIICRQNGNIYIQETLTGVVICQVTLPNEYRINSAQNPTCVPSANGQMLYMKGKIPEVKQSVSRATTINQSLLTPSIDNEEDDESSEEERLFAFPIRSFPTLDHYHMANRPKIPYVIHNTLENRVAALMKERVIQQAQRYSRLQTRWGQLQKELQTISKAKEEKLRQPKRHIVSAASVVKSLPMSDNKSPSLLLK